ncbi:hypothetical protein ACVIGB_001125 [Bradyrhizobium sp. USDA 4341]
MPANRSWLSCLGRYRMLRAGRRCQVATPPADRRVPSAGATGVSIATWQRLPARRRFPTPWPVPVSSPVAPMASCERLPMDRPPRCLGPRYRLPGDIVARWQRPPADHRRPPSAGATGFRRTSIATWQRLRGRFRASPGGGEIDSERLARELGHSPAECLKHAPSAKSSPPCNLAWQCRTQRLDHLFYGLRRHFQRLGSRLHCDNRRGQE